MSANGETQKNQQVERLCSTALQQEPLKGHRTKSEKVAKTTNE